MIISILNESAKSRRQCRYKYVWFSQNNGSYITVLRPLIETDISANGSRNYWNQSRSMKTTECYSNEGPSVYIYSWWKYTSDQQIEPGSNRKVPVHECHRSIVIIGIIGTAWKMKCHAQCQLTRNCSCFEISRGNGRAPSEKSRTFIRSVSNQTDRNRPRCSGMRVGGMRAGFKSRISNYTYRSGCRTPIKFVEGWFSRTELYFKKSYIAICRLEISHGNRQRIIHYEIARKISAIAS